MAEYKYRKTVARRRRVQRLKNKLVLFLLIAIIVPILGCLVLFAEVQNLTKRLEVVEMQLDSAQESALEEQQRLQELFLNGDTNAQQGNSVQEAAEGSDENNLMSKYQTGESVSMGIAEEIQEQEILHKVYLTFDDGPSIYTDEIMDILKQYDLKATFFVVGKEDDSSKAAIQRMVEEGHTIGLHSYSHNYSEIYRSVEAFAADFHRLQDYVSQITGHKSSVYRFPGGSSNTISDVDMLEFADYLQEQGVEYFDWNVSSGDGASVVLDVETLVANATKGITDRETSIVLLHDAAEKGTTVEALPFIIENILALDNTAILPITEETKPVQHIDNQNR